MKYSILDLKNMYNVENKTVDVFFQDKFIMTIDQVGTSLPSLVCHPNHTINEYLETPFITGGGYDNTDLYTIEGKKLTNFKFWAISNSPIVFENNLYFQVGTTSRKTGIIDSEGKIVIPFIYRQDISMGFMINIQKNGLLYVKKDGLYGIINLKNEVVFDFQPSWDEVMVRKMKDLGEWDDLKYVVKDGKLYNRRNLIN
jgi:hypothetical protein